MLAHARRPSAGTAGPGPRSGFTLIELLVSLLIIIVMAGVAAPAFLSERRPPDMDDAQGRIEALFRMARDSAVRSATPVTVVMDSASSLVWIDARTRMADELPPAEGAPTSGSAAPRGVQADGSIRLRAEGTFGGGSTLGQGLLLPGTGTRGPAGGESLDLPTSVKLELHQARTRFTFAPNGAVVGDSLILRGAGGESRLISLDPWSGRVRVR